MPTVLVIDDMPVIHWSVQMAVPDWTVLTASDGIAGLDMLRQHRSMLDLVVLDIDMPRLNGYDTCLQIRALCPTVPILPFTAVVAALPFLAELGCLPPLIKGIAPERLRAALHGACGATMLPPLPGSAVLAFAQQQATEREQTARLAAETAQRLVLFATAPMTRLGLYQLLAASGAATVYEATTAAATRSLISSLRVDLLVAAGRDQVAAMMIAQEAQLPLLVVTATVGEALALLGAAGVDGLLTEAEATAPATLAAALATVGKGSPYALPALDALLAASPLSPQECVLASLDLRGVSEQDAAQQLGVEVATIYRYHGRMFRKLGVTGVPGLRTWVQAQLLERSG